MSRNTAPNTRVLDLLLQDGKLTKSAYDRVVIHAQRSNDRVEEALIELNYIDEPTLLKFLANFYKTRFVSTEKLSKAGIDKGVLDMVPQRIAEKVRCFPVVYDFRTQTLSVVACDLEDDVGKQVQMATNVRDVKVYVARPAAIDAVIRKWYYGESTAFNELLAAAQQQSVGAIGGAATPQDMLENYGGIVLTDQAMQMQRPQTREERVDRSTRDLDLEKIAETVSRGTLAGAESTPPAQQGAVSREQYLSTLSVLVSLLESSRPELKGHSALVASLVKKVCERLGVSEREQNAMAIAAYLHDVGKTSAYHLTALNVAEYEGHRVQAQKVYATPARLFESARIPPGASEALSALYERFDGQGFPDKRTGKDIPLGARVLAIVETYADLTTNPRNPFRKTLTAKDACEALAKYRGTVFDPNLLDIFKLVVLGDNLREKLLADRLTVLLVDADAEETTVLELRLIELGYEVAIARTATDARRALEGQTYDIVVAEVDLKPFDGFTMLQQMKQSPNTRDVPLLFLTRRFDRESVNRGFALGAVDYLVKPTAVDVVVAKMKQILDGKKRSGGRGVSGSLREMGLPDVVQVLSHGRKSGQLRVTSAGRDGELFFSEGQIHHAVFGNARGAEAVYAMLGLSEGEFALDPNAKPPQRTVLDSTETLLLEGMRRVDERRR